MSWYASKWGKCFSDRENEAENRVLELLMDICGKLSANNLGWLERDNIANALKQHINANNPSIYQCLKDPDYGNIVDWLSARYTELFRLKPILPRLEAFLDNYERTRIRNKYAYRLKHSIR